MAGEIQLEGLDRVLKALSKCSKDVTDAALKGLEAGGMNIIVDAQQNLKANGSNVTSLLSNSGRTIRKGDDITVGFFDTTNKTGYAEYVEYGRRAGKMPPVDMLKAWAYKKFHLRDWKAATSMAWAIAKEIARKGTVPHPFFGPAVKKNYTKILNAVRDSVRKKIK